MFERDSEFMIICRGQYQNFEDGSCVFLAAVGAVTDVPDVVMRKFFRNAAIQ